MQNVSSTGANRSCREMFRGSPLEKSKCRQSVAIVKSNNEVNNSKQIFNIL